jgi:DNA-binding HxlR family transcriptional regulator|nr:winged helix-turn-helix transcriptional regulator [Rhodococcus erythropolis]
MDGSGARLDGIALTSQAVGNAWSWLVMREALFYGARRFADFHAALGISRAMLSARLTQLVDNGLLRRGLPGTSDAGDYLVTASGKDFFTCLMTAAVWGAAWSDDQQPSHELVVTHRACGSSANPSLRCESCSGVIEAWDVRTEHANRRLGVTRSSGRYHRAPDFNLLERNRPCPIARTQIVLGDWWSCMVVRESFFGVKRFDEYRSNLEVSTNILTTRLSRLVELGILRRSPYQTNPVRYDYRLTEKGMDLYPVALAILSWGERWKGSGDSLVPLVHLKCGGPLRVQLCCGGCSEVLDRAGVDIEDRGRAGQPSIVKINALHASR